MLASAGKFITHIAALQLVQRGAVALDAPVWPYLPELEAVPVLHRDGTARTAENPITLRTLLLHTSGLSDTDHPILRQFPEAVKAEAEKVAGSHPIVENFTMPLVFEPGAGFSYGCSIHWTQLLISRVITDQTFTQYIQKSIFDPLGMEHSTYTPRDVSKIWDNRLQMIERFEGKVIVADELSQGLFCSMLDMSKILSDLIAPASKLLAPEYVNLLFDGQLGESALKQLRENDENYKFSMGSEKLHGPSVNWSMAGLVAESALAGSQLPPGTVTWEGMPNVMWAINREWGLATFFATQIYPPGDESANDLALEFMRSAWTVFGRRDHSSYRR